MELSMVLRMWPTACWYVVAGLRFVGKLNIWGFLIAVGCTQQQLAERLKSATAERIDAGLLL